jgi:ATP synthase protein I
MKTDRRREDRFTEEIRRQSARARRSRGARWWQDLGVFGLVGWMIVVPTLAGIALGRVLDSHFHTGISWTLSLLLVGLAVGCTTVWRSIKDSLR